MHTWYDNVLGGIRSDYLSKSGSWRHLPVGIKNPHGMA